VRIEMIEATVRKTRTVAFCFGQSRTAGGLANYFACEMNVTEPDVQPT
jgi:hypothetical protein